MSILNQIKSLFCKTEAKEKRSILHMLDPMPQNSPFDINMALDAKFDVAMPYDNVKLESVHGITQDAIFSRGPAGVKRTAIFIGGRDLGLSLSMLDTCKQAMVPPFEVPVMADPSGAFTTAAALVALVEHELKNKHNKELKDCKAVVFGGTGPVGIATGALASLAGAHTTLVDHMSIGAAEDAAKEYNRLFKSDMHAACASSDEEKISLISDVDIIFCTAKAGIQVINANVLSQAKQLKVAGDVNAVPPMGIEGVEHDHKGEALVHASQSEGAIGIGALAVGDIKYKTQHQLLETMLNTEKPMYIDFRIAFTHARELLNK